jgi:hypothetical protein
LKESRRPARRNNCRRGVWVPDRRSLCSLVRDDGEEISRATIPKLSFHSATLHSSSPGSTGRSSIPETVVREREAAAYWVPRFRGGRQRVCGAWVDISEHSFAFSRHEVPELCKYILFLPRKREQGMPGARCTRGLVCKNAQRNAHTSIQVQRRQSGIPCAVVLRLMPCSPRRRIRLVTVAAGLMADQIRLDRYSHRQLGTSNGCRDHTVLPYAATSTNPSAGRVPAAEVLAKAFERRSFAQWLAAHRPSPPCDCQLRRRCRVHRIPSRVRDDSRSAPLWVGRREPVELICPTG